MSKQNTLNPNTNKKIGLKSFKVFLVVMLMTISFIGGYYINYLTKDPTTKTVDWVVSNIVKHGYFLDEETGEIRKFTGEEIADKIVSSFLDQYSEYYTPEEYSDVVKTNKGNLYGIGVSFLSTANDLKIFRVTGNSPAERAGLKAKDLIVGAETTGESKKYFSDRESFSEYLADKTKDEKFTLYYVRDDVEYGTTIQKSVFVSSYVKYYDNQKYGHFVDNENGTGLDFITEDAESLYAFDDKTCYIQFSAFSGHAVYEIDTVMTYAKNNGKTKVILDVRSNGGGKLDILCDVASYFIKSTQTKTPVLLYAKDADDRLTHYSATGDRTNPDTEKIVVLANEYSASATECLIGAMIHYGYAFDRNQLIIERGESGKTTTYGKGIMQTTFVNAVTGEALKLTTALLYFPNKVTSIHGKGIYTNSPNICTPDMVMTRALELMAN
jgi:carboxyl-terminal processing protease